MMSIVGGAAVPPLMGKVGRYGGRGRLVLVPVLCFVGVALYAVAGGSSRMREEVAAEPVSGLGEQGKEEAPGQGPVRFSGIWRDA